MAGGVDFFKTRPPSGRGDGRTLAAALWRNSVGKNFLHRGKSGTTPLQREPSRGGPPQIPPKIVAPRGNPGKRKRRSAAEPPMPPQPPGCLTGYALDEWHRLAPELHRLGLLTSL